MLFKFENAYMTDLAGQRKSISVYVFTDNIIGLIITSDKKENRIILRIMTRLESYYNLPELIYFDGFDKLEELISLFDNNLTGFYKIDEFNNHDRIIYLELDCIIGLVCIGTGISTNQIFIRHHNSIEIADDTQFAGLKRKLELSNV